MAISQALHSYFAVSDIARVRVRGLDGCGYIETLEDWAPRLQQGDLHFSSETDRIYHGLPATLMLDDPLWQRRIVLESSGSSTAILWNPWIDKSQRLSHFAEDAWQGMVCIETANVLDDFVLLAPGAEHVLGLRVMSEVLADW